jgi:sporulation protein YabP
MGGLFMVKMGTAEEYPKSPGAHKLSLTNRRSGSITGVSDVISFDISEVLLETELGMLQIKGADLHVNRLSLEKGEIDLEGRIDSLQYSEISDFKKGGESLINRLFR